MDRLRPSTKDSDIIVLEVTERLLEPRKQGICCGIVSPMNIKSNTHTILPTWLSKQEAYRDNNNRKNKDLESLITLKGNKCM